MILNTYDRTPASKNDKPIPVSVMISAILLYGIVGFAAFVSFYFSKSLIIGITVILAAILTTVIVILAKKDIEKSYIEITGDEICVIDYVLGAKKEKRIACSDITSAEICQAYSPKIKGYRFSPAGEHYIVFYCGKKYLFKIIHLPKTEEIFKQYIHK